MTFSPRLEGDAGAGAGQLRKHRTRIIEMCSSSLGPTPPARAHFRQLFRHHGESEPHVFRIRLPDGSVRWIEKSHARILRDEDDWAVRMLGLGVDVTQRYEAQEQVRRLVTSSSSALLRLSLRHQPPHLLLGLVALGHVHAQPQHPHRPVVLVPEDPRVGFDPAHGAVRQADAEHVGLALPVVPEELAEVGAGGGVVLREERVAR